MIKQWYYGNNYPCGMNARGTLVCPHAYTAQKYYNELFLNSSLFICLQLMHVIFLWHISVSSNCQLISHANEYDVLTPSLIPRPQVEKVVSKQNSVPSYPAVPYSMKCDLVIFINSYRHTFSAWSHKWGCIGHELVPTWVEPGHDEITVGCNRDWSHSEHWSMQDWNVELLAQKC